jgi:hypothetical protein
MSSSFARDLYQGQFGGVPGATQLVSRWETLLDNTRFLKYAEFEQHFKQGLDPMPDRDRLESLLRAAGHEFAVVEVVRDGSTLEIIFNRAPFYRWQYFGLYGIVVARVLPVPRPLTQTEAELVYSTLDRLLRGGRNWPTITRAPACSREFYRDLQSIRFPTSAHVVDMLTDIIKPRGRQVLGEQFKTVSACLEAACAIITTSVALKNGHKAVTKDDAVEGVEALLQLFEVDLHQLPPFQRIGRSGYEL